MLYFNIRETFHACGITNVYRALQDAGLSQRVAYNLSRNDSSTIRLSHLEKICRLLNCTPNDLIGFYPNKNTPLPPNHALVKLQHNTLPDMKELLNSLSFDERRDLANHIQKGRE